MTSSHPLLHPSADEQASLWAARLDGSVLTAEDRAALDTWLAQHPDHRALLSRYCQLSADLEAQLPQLPQAGDEVVAHRTGGYRSTPAWWGWGAAAAAVAAVVALIVQPSLRSGDDRTTLASSIAQRQEVTLVDGSQLELNAQTSVAINFTSAERRVRLASGQAYFSVRKDPRRPFLIETPAGSVHVTGTQFDVRSEHEGMLEVTVRQGSVQVRPEAGTSGPAATFDLVAGQRLRSGGPAGLTVENLSPRELDDALAWRRGEVVFKGTPLREALHYFGRYHGRRLSATTAAGETIVGGSYELQDLEGFLASIEDIWPNLQVVPQRAGAVQVRSRQEP